MSGVTPASGPEPRPDRPARPEDGSAADGAAPADRPAPVDRAGAFHRAASVDRPPGADRAADSVEPRATCTTAQLRRFIKSRPWIPMHELRRRFGIVGDDDTVSPMRVGSRTLFIGLPPPEARLMGELLASGDVGYELSLDPVTPIVVGVYPMRPVPRG
jgi:hypothetical protein